MTSNEPQSESDYRGPHSIRSNSASLGRVELQLRLCSLALIECCYRSVTAFFALISLLAGGFVPVLRGWLDDRVNGWSEVVELLGGYWPKRTLTTLDRDHGLVLNRCDAPLLFDEIREIGRKAGVRPPGQVRITYLPCCAVTAWGTRSRDRALLIGLPLLSVLDRLEFRAVLAHELAHLAHGDTGRAARTAQLVDAIEQDFHESIGPRWSLLRSWTRLWQGAASWLIGPIAIGREVRADRFAASLAGGMPAASALVKVALVQPLFREVLDHYDPVDAETVNLYSHFRLFWNQIPSSLLTDLRHRVYTRPPHPPQAAHPPLLDRIALVQSYPERPTTNADYLPAETILADIRFIEELLHQQLFGVVQDLGPSVFHRIN